MAAFLYVPDRYAQYPVTLSEAAQLLFDAMIPEASSMRWDAERRGKIMAYCRRATWLDLLSGRLHTYVQSPDSGTWYRVPQAHWASFVTPSLDLQEAIDALVLPHSLQQQSACAPVPPDLIEQPVVLWKDDVLQRVEAARSLGTAMLKADPEHQMLINTSSADRLSEVPTGDPGAPSKGVELYMAELERRIADREVLATVKAEADALYAWFVENHPLNKRPTPGTIRNRIRSRFRTATEDRAAHEM